MAIGPCKTLMDYVAFDGRGQRVVDTEGVTADVGAENEISNEQWGLAGGGGVEGYVSCRVSVG